MVPCRCIKINTFLVYKPGGGLRLARLSPITESLGTAPYQIRNDEYD